MKMITLHYEDPVDLLNKILDLINKETEQKNKPKPQPKTLTEDDLYNYIGKLLNSDNAAARTIVNYVKSIYPAAAFKILFKAASDILNGDKEEFTGTLYTTSTLDGRIIKVPTDQLKYCKNIAFFTSVADVKVALKAIGSLYNECFKA